MGNGVGGMVGGGGWYKLQMAFVDISKVDTWVGGRGEDNDSYPCISEVMKTLCTSERMATGGI